MRAKSCSIDPEKTFVVLGRIGRPHGLAGYVTVDFVGEHLRDYVGNTVGLTPVASLSPYLYLPSPVRHYKIMAIEPKQGRVKRILFDGIQDRNAAQSLVNSGIILPLLTMRQKAGATRKTTTCPLRELWYFEIYGLSVVDAESREPVGFISNIEDLGSNTLLTISLAPGKAATASELEIPLNYPHWGSADLAKQEIPLGEWRQFLSE